MDRDFDQLRKTFQEFGMETILKELSSWVQENQGNDKSHYLEKLKNDLNMTCARYTERNNEPIESP